MKDKKVGRNDKITVQFHQASGDNINYELA